MRMWFCYVHRYQFNGSDEVTGDDVLECGIRGSASGVLNDNRLITTVEAYEVYNGFSSLHGGEAEDHVLFSTFFIFSLFLFLYFSL